MFVLLLSVQDASATQEPVSFYEKHRCSPKIENLLEEYAEKIAWDHNRLENRSIGTYQEIPYFHKGNPLMSSKGEINYFSF